MIPTITIEGLLRDMIERGVTADAAAKALDEYIKTHPGDLEVMARQWALDAFNQKRTPLASIGYVWEDKTMKTPKPKKGGKKKKKGY